MIELQQKLLADKIRNTAFYHALRKVIKKDSTVIADIGSGTGFLSFLAVKLGAKKCYLYEYSDQLQLSRKIAKLNGIKNCVFCNMHSTEVKDPPKVDVVVSETIGNFAYEENIIETLNDAHRFLKPGGIIIPREIELFVSPVKSERLANEADSWDKIGFDIDLAPAKEAALNNMYVYKINPDEIAAKPVCMDKIDFMEKANKSIREGKAKWIFEEKKSVDGFCVWWRSKLMENIWIDTSPKSAPTHWDQIFLPLTSQIVVEKGDSVEFEFKSDSRLTVGINLKWTVTHIGKNKKGVVRMDTAKGFS